MEWSPALVKAARQAADLSQAEVARRAGISIDTVQRAENGKHEPGANALGAIASVLGVSIASLYVVHDPPHGNGSESDRGKSAGPDTAAAKGSAGADHSGG